VGGFADERHACVAEAISGHARQREDGAWPDLGDGTEQALKALLQLGGKEIVGQILETCSFLRALDPDEARPRA
jgi:hypothetical protein